MEIIGPALSLLKDSPNGWVVFASMLAIASGIFLKFRDADVNQMTSIGKMQQENLRTLIDQNKHLMEQNRGLAEDLGTVRNRLAENLDKTEETHAIILQLRARIAHLEDLVSHYQTQCEDCPNAKAKT